MKKLLLLLVFSWQALHTFGQVRTRNLPKAQHNDTISFWYDWTQKIERQVGLNSIEGTAYPLHFRLSTGGRILDVWQHEGAYQGSLTLWVNDADEKMQLYPRVYYQKFELSSSQAASLGRLLKEASVLNLPSEEDIKGWRQGCDGEEIVLQFSDKKHYYLKNYWTPTAQHGLPEALLIQQFRLEAFQMANVSLVEKSFELDIPFRCRDTGGGIVICKIVSSSEYWRYKREASKYLRRMEQQSR